MGFYLYKGLKKPLVFFGLKGKYIFKAVIIAGIGVISALVLSKFGILGSAIGLAVTGGGIYLLSKRQDKKGLYDKTKNEDDIFIFPINIKNYKNFKRMNNGKKTKI